MSDKLNMTPVKSSKHLDADDVENQTKPEETHDESNKRDSTTSSNNTQQPNNEPNKNDDKVAGSETDTGVAQDAAHLNTLLQKQAKRVARNPCTYFWTSLMLAILLSIIAMTVGDFSISPNFGGWQSRGTLLADRQAQLMLTQANGGKMLYGGDAAWNELIKNVQPGWEGAEDEDNNNDSSNETASANRRLSHQMSSKLNLPFKTTDNDHKLQRHLQDVQTGVLEGCGISYYNPETVFSDTRLWPVWKTTSSSDTVLNPDTLLDICLAEQNTQRVLEQEGLCIPCGDTGRCIPPFSVVFYARLVVENGMDLSCQELSQAWAPFQESTTEEWKVCVKALRETYDPKHVALPDVCPFGFWPSLVEHTFDENSLSRYTSSIFATQSSDVDALFNIADQFDRSDGKKVNGAYDTQFEDFVLQYTDESVATDMVLAMCSGLVVTIAIVLHTKSPFLSMIGLTQILLSFPLAYFVYKLILGLVFFPFLNFIGIFIIFALGAGDVFVAVDKWRHFRQEHPNASVEYIAAFALPDAANAMFLTTLTTAVAFFATAICPVAPIKLFAIFCGLLIVFDYLMNVMLVFPALCIYDAALVSKGGHQNANCFYSLSCLGINRNNDIYNQQGKDGGLHNNGDSNNSNREEDESEEVEDALAQDFDNLDKKEESETTDRLTQLLLTHYNALHSIRHPLLVVCLVVLGVTCYFASTLALPSSSDVRLLTEDVQFEQNYVHRKNLLSTKLEEASGSTAFVIWGVKPADTGDLNDPDTWTQLVLDKSFDPSTEEAQLYLADFCESIFEEDFADTTVANYTCPLTGFSNWLDQQAQLLNADGAGQQQDPVYVSHCNGATGLPLPQEDFHSCIIPWAQSVGEGSILPYQGKVRIMLFPFASRVTSGSSYNELDDEWNIIEDWIEDKLKSAPANTNVANGYFSSSDFWWYDTNGQMLVTASSAAAMALACAALVILFSSRSVMMTLYSTLTIVYVLTSVISMLVAMDWTLGFLESICIAILIGVSVDFVIHFSHAYTIPPGDTDRSERAKFALLSMGPSILMTAGTTIASTFVMLFATVVFFQKFALILFFTIIQATIGSFVVLLVLVDTIGPSDPTYFVNKVLSRCGSGVSEESQHTSTEDADEQEQ